MNARGGTRFAVSLRFHGDLTFFLPRGHVGGRVVRTLSEKTSVKDVIESCGVPHPEADLVLCDGVPAGFALQLTHDSAVDVYAVGADDDLFAESRLQRRDLRRFVADVHLGKLVRDLRLLGFDTIYRRDADDTWLVDVATEQDRALLTRDRRLLMHRVIRVGYCPRSDSAEQQLLEVVRRFGLAAAIRPYTLCLRCNGELEHVEKETVLAQLEPLTKLYYSDFRRCVGCRQIYWSGSHFGNLEARLRRLHGQFDPGQTTGVPENWA